MTPMVHGEDEGQRGYPRKIWRQLLERIEEESVGRDSEIEVLQPSVSHNYSNLPIFKNMNYTITIKDRVEQNVWLYLLTTRCFLFGS